MKKTTQIPRPSFNEERLLWQQGYKYIAGIDEVGRGAFAGPVVAAAVIFAPCMSDCSQIASCTRCSRNQMKQIHDSKLLPALKREKLATFIYQTALTYSIAEVPVSIINNIGIGKASQMAFRKAIRGLGQVPDFLLIDAFFVRHVRKQMQKPIIKGDRLSRSIAAASIIAKVYRDNLMKNLPEKYAQYGFGVHKGYGTKKHREMISMYGLSNLHRTSFDLLKYVNP